MKTYKTLINKKTGEYCKLDFGKITAMSCPHSWWVTTHEVNPTLKEIAETYQGGSIRLRTQRSNSSYPGRVEETCPCKINIGELHGLHDEYKRPTIDQAVKNWRKGRMLTR